MEMNRTILKVPCSSLPAADEFFRRLSGVDTANVPELYKETVENGRAAVLEKSEVVILYRFADILSKAENEVVLEDNVTLTGTIPPRVLADCKKVVVFMVTLRGFTHPETDDIMLEYMADTWASAYLECAQAWFAGEIRHWTKEQGLARTHLWCPGQYEFPLENQKSIYALLQPEEVGCGLTKHYMMTPVKTVSGILGITPGDCGMQLKPCDFCCFRKTCPGSDKGCAAI